MVLPLLIGAGLALGAIVQGKADRDAAKQINAQPAPVTTTSNTSTQDVDFARLRANAEAAGFNPITALRLTGGGALNISGTSTATGPKAFAPVPEWGTIVGGAISTGLTGYGQNALNPMEQAREKLEMDILNRQSTFGAAPTRLPSNVRYSEGINGPPAKRKINSQISVWVDALNGGKGGYVNIIDPELMESGASEAGTSMAILGSAIALQYGPQAAQDFYRSGMDDTAAGQAIKKGASNYQESARNVQGQSIRQTGGQSTPLSWPSLPKAENTYGSIRW